MHEMFLRLTAPVNDAERALLEAIGMRPDGYRVLVRRRLTIAVGRRLWLAGLPAAVITLAVTYGYGVAWSLIAAVVSAAGLVVSFAGHEAGHLLLGRHAKGIAARMIVVRASGGVSIVEGRHERARDAALFAAGGPLATAIIGGSFFFGGVLLPVAPLALGLTVTAILNGILLALNLMPVAPMDGYLLFRSAMWAEIGDRPEAERRAIGWSRAVIAWSLLCALLVLDRSGRYGALALFAVATFAFQHHATARQLAGARLRPRRRT